MGKEEDDMDAWYNRKLKKEEINRRLDRIGKTLDVLEGLKKIDSKELDLKIIQARNNVKRLRAKRNTIRTKYGLVPRGTIDKDTGKDVEEI